MARASTIDNSLSNFGRTIMDCCILAGIKEAPKPEEIVLLREQWLAYHGGVRLAEFRFAWELTINQILPAVEHYQQFDLRYMAAVLKNYCEARTEWNKEIARATETTPEITEEQKREADAIWEASMRKQYSDYKETGRLLIEMPMQQYAGFVAKGWAKELTEDDLDKHVDEARTLVVEDLKKKRVNAKGGGFRAINESIRRLKEGEPREHEANLVMQMIHRLAIKGLYDSGDLRW